MALRDPYTFHRRMIQVDFSASEKAKIARKASQDKFYETIKEENKKPPQVVEASVSSSTPAPAPAPSPIPAPIQEVAPGTTEVPVPEVAS